MGSLVSLCVASLVCVEGEVDSVAENTGMGSARCLLSRLKGRSEFTGLKEQGGQRGGTLALFSGLAS